MLGSASFKARHSAHSLFLQLPPLTPPPRSARHREAIAVREAFFRDDANIYSFLSLLV